MSIHKIWLVGMSLYIFCLAIGILQLQKNQNINKVRAFSLIELISDEGNADFPQESEPKRNQLASSFEVEEDDDDSERTYIHISVSKPSMNRMISLVHAEKYPSVQLDINTPPPRI